jgi:uncharacterized membrane protein (DUF4010 family)
VVDPYLDKVELIGLAVGLGLLIGLERERAGKEAGLRTFALVALAGALTTLLAPAYSLAVLAFVVVLVLVMNLGAHRHGREVETTTAAALFVTALSGILVGQGHLFTPVAGTIVMLGLLAWKEEMVGFTRHLSQEEVHAGITLLLLALVILPVLPSWAVDPWGLVFPRKIWLMVVLISAIGFGNYVLLRLYGARGVTYTGILGGLVNSTAAVAELAQHAQVHPDMQEYIFRGVMLAKTAMFLRNGLILAIFAPGALPVGLLPMGLILTVTLSLAWFSRSRTESVPPPITMSSPFSLKGALAFGMIFLGLTVVAGAAQRFGGALGFYVISFAGGLVSSSSTAASAANLISQRQISAETGGLGVVLTSLASAVVLIPIVWRASPALGRRMAIATALIVAAGGIGWLLNPWFLHHLVFAYSNV